MSTKQKIILLSYRDGYSERKISRELGVNRETVHKYLTEYAAAREKLSMTSVPDDLLIEEIVKTPKYNSDNRSKRKFTKEMSLIVDQLLSANDEKKSQGLHKQMMKKIDILEHLQNLGYDIGYTSVCHYINIKLEKRKEAFIRQIYEPGDVCEFDWGEVKLIIKGRRQVLYMAVFTPAMSNYRFSILFYRQDTGAFLQSHVVFFEHIGGVFHHMVYDNMRVAVRRFIGFSEKEPTEALLKLSAYYQFYFRFCNIASGNEKGHVERSVEYIRRKAFSGKDSFPTLEAANLWLAETCNRLNNSSKGKDKSTPAVIITEEKKHLAPLQPSFDCSTMEQCRVDKYSVITFATNRYSVPDHLVGKIVDVKIYPERLICYFNNKVICKHERRFSRQGWYIEIDHYLYTLKRKPGALASSQALSTAPEKVKALYGNYFYDKPKDFIDLLLFLRDYNYGFDQVNKAISKLEQTSPHDISLDKIKVLCMQKNEVYKPVLDHDNQILLQSQNQLKELSSLLNF